MQFYYAKFGDELFSAEDIYPNAQDRFHSEMKTRTGMRSEEAVAIGSCGTFLYNLVEPVSGNISLYLS
jgi:hypothetical protein